MSELQEHMRRLRRELLEAAGQFVRSGRDPKVPARRTLLELQQRLDHLRQAIWDARKLCDPNLRPFPRDAERPAPPTLTERIVHVIDERKKTA